MSETAQAASLETFGYKQELKRSLSLSDLLVYGLVFIVPGAPIAVFGNTVAIANKITIRVRSHRTIQARNTSRGTRVKGFRSNNPATQSCTWLKVEPA